MWLVPACLLEGRLLAAASLLAAGMNSPPKTGVSHHLELPVAPAAELRRL